MKKLIGHVGVDSGQLVLCDPCYIENEWRRKPYRDIRIYEVDWKGQKLRINFGNYLRRGFTCESQIPRFNGLTMNELVAQGFAKRIPNQPTGEFSYEGCCWATQADEQAGQLDYAMCHAGAGVVFSTGYGDGYYPVFATYRKGRIQKVEVVFFDPKEE